MAAGQKRQSGWCAPRLTGQVAGRFYQRGIFSGAEAADTSY